MRDLADPVLEQESGQRGSAHLESVRGTPHQSAPSALPISLRHPSIRPSIHPSTVHQRIHESINHPAESQAASASMQSQSINRTKCATPASAMHHAPGSGCARFALTRAQHHACGSNATPSCASFNRGSSLNTFRAGLRAKSQVHTERLDFLARSRD